MLRRAVARQVPRRRHAQPAVVGHAHAHQRGIGQVADPHRAVVALARQVDHAVAEVERDGHVRVQLAKARHQRCHVAPAEPRRRRDPQVPAGLDAAGAHAGLGIGQVGQQALAVFQEGTALMGQRQATGGADHQLDAQALLQRVDPPAHDGRRHALGLGRRREAAAGGDRDEGLELLELVHPSPDYGRIKHARVMNQITCRALTLLHGFEYSSQQGRAALPRAHPRH